MKGYDYISATRRCAARVREIGLLDWSKRLLDRLDHSSTGGELVTGVRRELKTLLQSGNALPDDLKQLIAEILREIDETGW